MQKRRAAKQRRDWQCFSCVIAPRSFLAHPLRLRRKRYSNVMKTPDYGNSSLHARAARRIFREALECGSDRATALGGRGTVTSRKLREHHTLRVVTIPPPSQRGGHA